MTPLKFVGNSGKISVAALFAGLLALSIACGGNGAKTLTQAPALSTAEAATPSVSPTPELTLPPAPSPSPSPSPTPQPFQPIAGVAVGGPISSYVSPTTKSERVRDIAEYTTLMLVDQARGENWIVGDQTWPMAIQDWGTLWYRLEDGSYVYSAFIFLLRPGEQAPWELKGRPNKSVVVDLDAQQAVAMVDGAEVHRMAITSGKAGFESPVGSHRIFSWGRVRSERMTSSQAGFDESVDPYDVQRVLFTQYFASGGYALHMNYWQPYAAFGGYPTSHGCIGLLLHDAQYLWMFAQAGTPVIIQSKYAPPPTATPSPTPSPVPTPEPTQTPAPTPTAPNPFGPTATATAQG